MSICGLKIFINKRVLNKYVKTWWKNWIIIISLVAALFTIVNSFYGWFTPEEEIKPGFICPDGTMVSEPEKCLICNEDGLCQETEDCSCEDCEDQVECIIQRIEEKEYLLLLNNPKKIEGKRVKVTEITKKGFVTVDVEDEVITIESTRQENIIGGLRITTQEIIYNNLKPKDSMVIIKIEEYKTENNLT